MVYGACHSNATLSPALQYILANAREDYRATNQKTPRMERRSSKETMRALVATNPISL